MKMTKKTDFLKEKELTIKDMPKTLKEANLLAKQIKTIDVNTKGQLEILTKGFKDLTDILNKMMINNIDNQVIRDLNEKIEKLQNEKCNHVCKIVYENKEKKAEQEKEEKKKVENKKKETVPVPTPPEFNLIDPESEPTKQDFTSPWLQAASRKLKKKKQNHYQIKLLRKSLLI